MPARRTAATVPFGLVHEGVALPQVRRAGRHQDDGVVRGPERAVDPVLAGSQSHPYGSFVTVTEPTVRGCPPCVTSRKSFHIWAPVNVASRRTIDAVFHVFVSAR